MMERFQTLRSNSNLRHYTEVVHNPSAATAAYASGAAAVIAGKKRKTGPKTDVGQGRA
jgi:hypothetical protein